MNPKHSLVFAIACLQIEMSASLRLPLCSARRRTSTTLIHRRYVTELLMSKGEADKNGESDRPIHNNQSASWEKPKSPIILALLQKTASRAIRTLSTTTSANWDDVTEEANTKDAIQNVLDAATLRSSSALGDEFTGANKQSSSIDPDKPSEPHQDKRTYLNNPAVTPTALAHSLWQSTIIPYQDTVIDATCGNGKDCLALIRMLFPKHQFSDEDTHVGNGNVHPHLIGIDIQSRAISNTKRSLLSSLPENIYYNHVTLLARSHEHLADIFVPREDGKNQQVGLVCYNLGYLPGGATENYKETKTQTQTTLNSITDAALLLRVGGLLSIMSYPASNLEESMAVEHFAEGLAMLTTRDDEGWRGYLEGIPDYPSNGSASEESGGPNNNGGRIRDIVSRSIERVAKEGPAKQTWRSFVHKPLGRSLSPILVTAYRIK